MEALEILPSSRIYPKIHFEPLRSSGVTVLTVKDVCKAYGPKKVLENVSFEVERGEKIGIIGPNGIGKSTLLEILTANQNADRGNFNWGHAARWAYFPQDHKREVHGSWTLLDWLGQFDRDMPQEKLRELLGRVLFSGEIVNQSITTLSGGETARLLLAKIMLAKPNVLIFDEPTNHLDMEAIEELTTALDAFEGTLIFVSHNRFFVSSLAKRIIELSEKGVKEFRGNYQEYLEKENSDHLTTQVALNQRYAKDQKPVSSDYLDQKKIKSQKAQLKKKVSLAEESCHKLENQIKNIEQEMAAPEFYLKTQRDQQLKLAQRKIQLEEDLNRAMELWETLSLQLQNCEGIS